MIAAAQKTIADVIERCDGESPMVGDALDLLDALGLPHSFQKTVLNLLDDIVYNHKVYQAFQSDPRNAYDNYVLEPGERGTYDISTLELICESFASEAEKGIKSLLNLSVVAHD